MSFQKPVAEENKLNESDLEVLACAGAEIGIAEVMRRTRLSREQVIASLKRAANVLPGYLDGLFTQAKDAKAPSSHRQMAAQATQSLSAVIGWVTRLQATLAKTQPDLRAA